MHGGQDDPISEDLAAPPMGGSPSVTDVAAAHVDGAPPPPPPVPVDPVLPEGEAKPAAPIDVAVAPTRGAETWYRTDQDRFRSVHRRANPWYRRLTRGIIGLSFVAAAGVGLFYGARLVQDYLDRDRLPGEGANVPPIRATSFELRSTAPAPVLDGTLTLDAETETFEFIGRGTGTQAGTQVVSPDGVNTYVRRGSGAWLTATADDQVVADVQLAVTYLRDDDSADDILTNQLRRGFVDLIDRTEIGQGDNELRRYELRLDTRSFSANFPLQYQEFEARAIPSVQAVRGLLVTITLDDRDVLVAVDDAGTNWSWQRLSYTDQPFAPIDPAEDPDGNAIEITDGNLEDG